MWIVLLLKYYFKLFSKNSLHAETIQREYKGDPVVGTILNVIETMFWFY